ncbi:hypothetical protein [Streptomyces sp. NPDC089919]|uniref:hypothetical protein n=1 Tax=Streptomyces sp. NPDC089919 TaxID=3155188 RepID=UPI003426C14C
MNHRLRPLRRQCFLAAAVAAGLLLAGCANSAESSTVRTSGASDPTRTASGPVSPAAATSTGPASAAPADHGLGPGLQPLWPFSTLAQAQAWQRSYREGGHQPWHLDAPATALAFVQGHLGFKDMDRISSRSVNGRDARIGVGLGSPEEARRGTAAVLHLVRYGTGPDAPWEVVGTDDTTLSLTVPAYGAKAASPLRVGGRITGVDESVRVQVRQPSTPTPLGSTCCTSAGGTNTPWTATVSYTHATDPVLTVVATTGGHLADVERFALTAVRTD